eukprot:9477851-Pyramimonas_sp.AAC.1
MAPDKFHWALIEVKSEGQRLTPPEAGKQALNSSASTRTGASRPLSAPEPRGFAREHGPSAGRPRR